MKSVQKFFHENADKIVSARLDEHGFTFHGATGNLIGENTRYGYIYPGWKLTARGAKRTMEKLGFVESGSQSGLMAGDYFSWRLDK